MTAKVIYNPYAARWNALRRKPEVEQSLQAEGIEYELVQSDSADQIVGIAESAAREGFSPIIAAGGDGTFGEVVNGLYRTDQEGVLGPLGILPLGTANDLPVNLDMPLGLREAARVIAGGKTRRIDLGKANEWVFDNNSAVGLEPLVTIYNIRMVKLRGVIRYFVAALRAINQKPEWTMSLEWDDGSYEGPVSLVSVGNCPVTGGLFRMAPGADPTDGLLTFVVGYASTRRRMLGLLPKVISGTHIHDPAVQQYHTRRLFIRSVPSTPIQVDGELRGTDLTEVLYEALPARLDILVP
ncbi:MAG: diacylglycerol kinase family lipid kinase [Anaerolineaceae bacterium]|nr:MAG: diacylglycerol kinase family lipid kinase [Anaerolineaceae bacterium]